MLFKFKRYYKNDILNSMNIKERLVKKNLKYKGKVIDCYCDEVKLPNGKHSTREYFSHPGASAILPFIDKNKIILVKQYRYPIRQITYEIPAGKMDKGESPLKCIKRELREETGYTAKTIKKILSFYPTPAFSNEILHIFSAFNLKQGIISPDEDEFLSNVIIDFNKAIDMIYSGEIIDSKTIIALLHYKNTQKLLI
jgi:ADP-ribose pyrophosphatase